MDKSSNGLWPDLKYSKNINRLWRNLFKLLTHNTVTRNFSYQIEDEKRINIILMELKVYGEI